MTPVPTTFASTSDGLNFQDPLISSDETRSLISLRQDGKAGSVPQIVAAVDSQGNTTNKTFVLLAEPETGDYMLSDYLTVTNTGGSINYTLAYNDDNGPQTLPVVVATVPGPFSTNYAGFHSGGSTPACNPQCMRVVAGAPVTVTIDNVVATDYNYYAKLLKL